MKRPPLTLRLIRTCRRKKSSFSFGELTALPGARGEEREAAAVLDAASRGVAGAVSVDVMEERINADNAGTCLGGSEIAPKSRRKHGAF
jgi:hypothetical protein